MKPTDKDVWAWWNALPGAEQNRRRREVESYGLDPDKAPFITYEPFPAQPRCKHGNGPGCEECWRDINKEGSSTESDRDGGEQ